MNIPLSSGSVNLPPSTIISPALTLTKKKVHTLLLLRFSTLGCLLESLQDEYYTYFDEELNPSSFGFSTIMEMLDAMPKEVCVSDMKDRSSKVIHPQPLNHKKTVEMIKIIFPISSKPMTNQVQPFIPESNENINNNNTLQSTNSNSTNSTNKLKVYPIFATSNNVLTQENGVDIEAQSSLPPTQNSISQDSQGSSKGRGQGRTSKRGQSRASTRGRRLRLESKEDNTENDTNSNSNTNNDNNISSSSTSSKRPLTDAPTPSEKESGSSGAVNNNVSSPQSNKRKKKTTEEPPATVFSPVPVSVPVAEVTIKTEPVSPVKETEKEKSPNKNTNKSKKKTNTNNKEQTFTLSSRHVQNNEVDSPSTLLNGELMETETETDGADADKNEAGINLNIVRWNTSLNGKVLKLGGSSDKTDKSGKSDKNDKTETAETPENLDKIKGEKEMVGNRRQSCRARRTIEQFDASPLPPLKKTEPKKPQFSSTDVTALPEIFKCIEEELQEKRCGQAMEKAWLTIFDMNIVNPDAELLLKTSELFIKCHEEFPTKTNLTEYMMGALGNIIMNEDINLRKTLMTSTQVPKVLFEFLETPRFTRGNLKMKIEFSVCELLLAFLSDGAELWKLEEPSRESVCSMVWDTIEKWDVNTYLIINEFHYNSLVTNVKFLQLNHTPVCQLWSSWTLANFFIARPELYVKLLQDAHGEKELNEIVSNCKDETIVKYAKLAIESMKKWLERD